MNPSTYVEMKPSEILAAALKLVKNPKRWRQGRNTRRRNGVTQHCSTGALLRVRLERSTSVEDADAAESFLASEMEDCVADFNDSHEHAEVVAAFETAIAKAKAAGK